MLKIVKVLPYDVYGNGVGMYKRVCDLLDQSYDPPSLHIGEMVVDADVLFCSPRERAKTCLSEYDCSRSIESPLFNEIPFSFSDSCSEEIFNSEKGAAVRRVFAEKFENNLLSISHEQLHEEMRIVLSLSRSGENPTAVSHTFRMKIIEIYLLVGEQLFQNPKVIHKYVSSENKIYDFGHIIQI